MKCLFFSGLLLTSVLLGCGSQDDDVALVTPSPLAYSSVVIMRVDAAPSPTPVTIRDARTVSQLLEFLGDIRGIEDALPPGGWEGKYSLVFDGDEGDRISITTSYDDEYWSSGKGDRRILKSGLSQFLDSILEMAKAEEL